MDKFDIITVGGAVQDITFYTSDGKILKNQEKDPTCLKLLCFEYGAKIKIEDANFSFGGGAQNAAVSFSRLGYKVAALISVGDDSNGKNIIDNLKKNKVDVKLVQVKKNESTGFSFVLTDKKTSEHVVFSHRGASAKLKIGNVLEKTFSKWVYMTSLSGNWEKDIASNIFKYKKNVGCKVAWNPGKRQLEAGYSKLKKYLKETAVLILNKDEAIELRISNGSIPRVSKTRDLIKELYEMVGVDGKIPLYSPLGKWGIFKIIVLTDGKKGAFAYDGNKIYYSPVIDVKRVDTTGVGDAFGSSFIAGLEMYNGDIQKALDLGNLNTSSVIGKVGAENGLLYRKDVV